MDHALHMKLSFPTDSVENLGTEVTYTISEDFMDIAISEGDEEERSG